MSSVVSPSIRRVKALVHNGRIPADPVTELILALNERYAAVGLPAPDLTTLERPQIAQPLHSAILGLSGLFYRPDSTTVTLGALQALGVKLSGAVFNSNDLLAARAALRFLEYIPSSPVTTTFNFEYAYLPDSEIYVAPYSSWALPARNLAGHDMVTWRVSSATSDLNGVFWIGSGSYSTTQWPLLLGLKERPLATEDEEIITTEDSFFILPEFEGLIQNHPDLRIASDHGAFTISGLARPRFAHLSSENIPAAPRPHAGLAPNRAEVGGHVRGTFTSPAPGLHYTVRVTSPVLVHPQLYGIVASGTTGGYLVSYTFTVPTVPETGVYFVEVIFDTGERLRSVLGIAR